MDLRIADLGRLTGNVLLYGGPYSNLQAMRSLLDRADRLGIPVTRRICTGDTVAYGGDPLAVADLVEARGGCTVAGNCERQIGTGSASCGCGFDAGSVCDLASRGWFAHATDTLGATGHPSRFADLPDLAVFTHGTRRIAVLHGGVSDVARFIWPTSDEAVFAEERAAVERAVGPVQGIVAGHCGIAFHRRVAGIDWINAGVIGMPPHDGRTATRFAVLGERGPVFHRLDYDHEGAAVAMTAAGLTRGYERALLTGIWPSQDVLPAALRR